QRHSNGRIIFDAGSRGQRVGDVHGLSDTDGLAVGFGGVLSVSLQGPSFMGSGPGWGDGGWPFCGGMVAATKATVVADRLDLVFGDAFAGVGTCSSRRAGACGQIYLPAADRDLCRDDMA